MRRSILAQEICWVAPFGDAAFAAARGGEGDAAGCRLPKALKPARRRQLVDEIRATWQVSIRRACGVVRARRSTYHYRGRRADQAVLKTRIREIAETRMRYGYRRIHVLLRREGWDVNKKRIYRLYKEQGLQLRNKLPKHQATPASSY
jgi:putative transposase